MDPINEDLHTLLELELNKDSYKNALTFIVTLTSDPDDPYSLSSLRQHADSDWLESNAERYHFDYEDFTNALDAIEQVYS